MVDSEAPATLSVVTNLLDQNPSPNGEAAFYTATDRGQFSFRPRRIDIVEPTRTPNWRLIQYPDGNRKLYHLPTDPHEYYNVIDQPKNTCVVKRLERLLVSELGELSGE